jgi:hypothetical protein
MQPPVAELPRFQQVQQAFTRHMRDPDNAPAPAGVEDRRMGIYRDLLYNNVQSFMADCYPVLRKVCNDATWHGLMRDYFRTHQAHTPLFPKMPREFLQYLEQERGSRAGDFRFLLELAHYEWVETALIFDSRKLEFSGVDPAGDLLNGVPVLSPLALPLAYKYPVHRISREYQPEAAPAQPTYLVVYRDRADKVGFLELNPVSARLLELVQQADGRSARILLCQIADELRHPDAGAVERGGAEILEDLRRRDVILGTRMN